ncbi:hypothetical protein NLJ89_g4908 [Agrocybe chaxingu]|uniref:HTH CENPB-type domain-containing protein n=1 Tax=Agrocybe chaxingu TaxID=84603 RepID=A0A9W8MU45_9AGAR|nr:hypothetical protein NLJ89_g4908 [Agrocybe chaxingu]
MPAKKTQPTVQVDAQDLESKTTEQRLQMAIDAINRNGFYKNSNPILSFREAAIIFNVGKTTLTARFKGRTTRVEAHEKEKKLSTACEEALVEWVKSMGRRNVPLHPSAVAEHACVISGVDIGETWIRRFRACHPDLKAKWTTGMEKCRAGAVNENEVTNFYDEYNQLVKDYNIKPENIYNMDEKGCQLGIGASVKALIDKKQKDCQMIEDGNRELITVIECVCADGTAIPPSVVFRGKRRDLEWGRDNPCGAR